MLIYDIHLKYPGNALMLAKTPLNIIGKLTTIPVTADADPKSENKHPTKNPNEVPTKVHKFETSTKNIKFPKEGANPTTKYIIDE